MLSFDLKNIEYTHPNKFSTIPSPDGDGGDEENLNKNLLGWVVQAFSIKNLTNLGLPLLRGNQITVVRYFDDKQPPWLIY